MNQRDTPPAIPRLVMDLVMPGQGQRSGPSQRECHHRLLDEKKCCPPWNTRSIP